jgi:branched-chain amino acid transport system permease protein
MWRRNEGISPAMTQVIQIVIDALSLASMYTLVALGIGLIFGVLRLINFAQGDFIAIGAYALIVPSTSAVATMFIGEWPWPGMVAATILVVILFALITERIAFRPLRRADPTTLLIASFAVSYFIQSALLLIYGARPKAVDIGRGLADQIVIGAFSIPKLDILTIVVAGALLVGLIIFLTQTSIGIQTRAAAEDFGMARLLGVRSNRVIAVAFALSGILAAAVSLLYVARSGVLAPRMGLPLALFGFVSTVIGGVGSLPGAALGGFVVGVTTAVLQDVLPESVASIRDVFVFAAVIAILLVRPDGMVRARSSRERV